MKKITLSLAFVVICIILLIAIASLIVIIAVDRKIPPPLQRGITLNGVTSGDADEMVSNFKKDKKCKGKTKAIWLSKIWLDSVVRAVDTIEHGDGVRMYFAKELEDKKNTAVLVSTFKLGPDNSAESGSDHEDYYQHGGQFFESVAAVPEIDTKETPGALLFGDTCPCSFAKMLIPSPHDNHIDCPQAYAAVQNFIKKGENHEMNTESEWFSIRFLERIDNILTKQTKQYPNEPGDGIRIYFAKHTSKTTEERNHMDKEAFIIIPTKRYLLKNDKYCHYDFFCADIKLAWAETANAPGGGDNGEQCQPNCQGSTLPQN